MAEGRCNSWFVELLLDEQIDLPELLSRLVRVQAVSVRGTEAAGFRRSGDWMISVAHIRPGDASQEARAKALAILAEMGEACVSESKDGAFAVGRSSAGETQYCLVALLRRAGGVIGVSCVIAPCLDDDDALWK